MVDDPGGGGAERRRSGRAADGVRDEVEGGLGGGGVERDREGAALGEGISGGRVSEPPLEGLRGARREGNESGKDSETSGRAHGWGTEDRLAWVEGALLYFVCL